MDGNSWNISLGSMRTMFSLEMAVSSSDNTDVSDVMCRREQLHVMMSVGKKKKMMKGYFCSFHLRFHSHSPVHVNISKLNDLFTFVIDVRCQ